jgi:hypothetical protein
MLFVSKNTSCTIVKGGRELKRAKALLWSIAALAVALSLAVAVPAYAAGPLLTKEVTPLQPNVYNLTDTIHYVLAIINTNTAESIRVLAVSDVLPDGLPGVLTGPSTPYTLAPGQNATYTCDWVATRTDPVVNTFHASGYQISSLNDTFDLSTTKSSTVIGREVGGTASLVNKVWLVVPWAVVLGCAGFAALAVLRKRRRA